MANEVTDSTIKVNTFKSIYKIINDNKPSGWTVLSSYPESKPVFPCIVINPANVTTQAPLYRIDGKKFDIKVELEFYALSSSRKETLDTGIDSVRNTILTNMTALKAQNLVLATTTPVDETNAGTIEVNGIKLNSAFMMINLRKI